MKLLITAVGQRTEHWTDLFAELSAMPDVELSVAVADVSDLTRRILTEQTEHAGITAIHLPHALSESSTGHMASVIFQPRAMRALAGQCPDVIHVVGEASYFSTQQVISWRNRHRPLVPLTIFAAQNVLMRFPMPFPVFEHRSFANADHLFPVTPAAQEIIRQKGYSGPSTVVPLGVDTSRFRPARSAKHRRPFTVGFVGRLEPHKGIRDLLVATEQVDCRLLLVGSGSEAASVEEAIVRRGKSVQLHEWADHDELPSLLAGMDVLVLPSVETMQRNVLPWVAITWREQFGRVLVEAMACGVPVVGSDCGEIPHVIGDAGLIFPAGDVQALAACLARIRDNPLFAEHLARRGLDRVTGNFSWRSVAEQMSCAWQQLLPWQRKQHKKKPQAVQALRQTR